MSDYGDEYSDYGEEWFYVEDEYMAADDLAEHAVASPPPTTYGDEDAQSDWDRFDYFNDLEYASDGYDNATFEVHQAKGTDTRLKRKRATKGSHSKKRRSGEHVHIKADTSRLEHSPIVWRAQKDRGIEPKLLDDNAQSYALLKNWRDKLKDTPQWARGSPPESPVTRASRGKSAAAVQPVSPPSDIGGDHIDAEDEEDGDDMGISQEALMAALQRQLAAAGGPLSGMDPQQLLEFAMRMASNKDAGDDIAGEMAEAMLGGDDEGDDADAEENLLSWVAQQRNTSTQLDASENIPKSPEVPSTSTRPPTPPSSEANRSVCASETVINGSHSDTRSTASLKRKADDDDSGHEGAKVTKKRVTKAVDTPARAAPARATRSTRKRS